MPSSSPEVETLYKVDGELHCYGHARRLLDRGLKLPTVQRRSAVCHICDSPAVRVPKAYEALAHAFEHGSGPEEVALFARALLAELQRGDGPRGGGVATVVLANALKMAPGVVQTDALMADMPEEELTELFLEFVGEVLDWWDARYVRIQRALIPIYGGPYQDLPAALECVVSGRGSGQYRVTYVAVSVVEPHAVSFEGAVRRDQKDFVHDVAAWLRQRIPTLDDYAIHHLAGQLESLRECAAGVRKKHRRAHP